jgi:hypothetical protein
VKALVDFAQVILIQMGINLRRTDVRMTQKFLHGAQVRARFD